MPTLTEKDNDTVIDAAKDSVVEVVLPSNPSTGFAWQSTDTSAGRLESVRHDAVNPGVPGSTQQAHFRFVVERSGHFELSYSRPWEKTTTPTRLFGVTINMT